MRTKSLVLAAAALAGGLLSASAQSNVYSLNIVGYVNKALPNGYSLVANPLDDGNGNVSSNLVPAALPTKSQIVVYDQVNGYVTATKTSTGGWTTSFPIPPGKGYFVKVNGGSTLTNTYVGNVAGAVPGSITNSLPGGYSLVGSPYPIGGIATNSGSNTLNLPGTLPTKSQIITYDQVNGYVTATKTSTGGWTTAQQIDVGTGFFIKNNGATAINWTQDVGQ